MRFTVVSAALLAAVLGSNAAFAQQALATIKDPAELPPAGFKGQMYVDSKGCVFLRAGYGGTVNWVPRVGANRKPLCGFPPTLQAMAKPIEVAEAAVKYLRDGIITNSINAPRGKVDPDTASYLPLAERMGSFIHQINGNNPIDELIITYCGELSKKQTKMITVSAVIGVLNNIIGVGNANMINALPVAKAKGISITESSTEKSEEYSNMIELRIVSNKKSTVIRGTVFGEQPRLVGFNEFSFDVAMSGDMVFLTYMDAPGVIGKLGTVFGKAGINIAQMAVSRMDKEALMIITVDQTVTPEVLKEAAASVGSKDARFVDLV